MASGPFGIAPTIPLLRRSVIDPVTGAPVVTSAPPARGRLPSLGSVLNGVLSGASEAGHDLVDGTLGAIVRTDARMNGQMPMHDEFGRLSLDTIGDLYGAAGTAMTGSMPFAAPKGALRSFGGAAKAGGDDALASLEAALGSVQPEASVAPRRLDPSAASWDVYHGSPAGPDFARFDPSASANQAERGAVFFAPSADTASGYAGAAPGSGEAGSRVFRATVEPGKTAVFDVGHLAETDPAFNARARALTVAESPAHGTSFDRYMGSFQSERARNREFSEQARALGYEPSAPDGLSFGYGHIGAAIERAKAQGLDTAILRGLAEHGGEDQLIALTPGRVRSHYAPDQLLYGGAGLAAGTAGALSMPGDAGAAPSQGKPTMSSGIGRLSTLDIMRFLGQPTGAPASFDERFNQAPAGQGYGVDPSAVTKLRTGLLGQVPPSGIVPAPQQEDPASAPSPAPAPIAPPPAMPRPAPPSAVAAASPADIPAAGAAPVMGAGSTAPEPSFGDKFNSVLGKSSDLLTALGMGLMTKRGFAPGIAAGLQYADTAATKKAATSLAQAEYALKASKLAREQNSENQTARMIADKLGIPIDQAAGLAGNAAFTGEFFKSNYSVPAGWQKGSDGRLAPVPGGENDPAYIQSKAQAAATGSAAGTPERDYALSPGQTRYSGETNQPIAAMPDRDKQVQTAANLRKEIHTLPSYKNYTQAVPIYQGMVETADRDSKASDLNLIYGLGKIMDPGSVVREGELQMARDTQGAADKLIGMYNGVMGGARLSQQARQQLLTEAYGRIQSYENAFQQDRRGYEGIVGRQGMNMDDVLPNFSAAKPYAPAKKPEPKVVGPDHKVINGKPYSRGADGAWYED